MPSNAVTVQAAHSTVTLQYDSSANAALAQYVAGAIQAGIAGGSIIPADSSFTGMNPPPIPNGKTGEWVQNTPAVGQTKLSKNIDFVVAASSFNVFANADANQTLLAGSASGTFVSAAPTASGSIIAGGGNDNVMIQPSDSGAWLIALGNGNDTIRALGSGNDTISVGSGNDSIFLGSGNNVVTTGGSATVSASNGNETVTGLGTTVVYGNASNLTFVAGGGATVFGGTGSDTVTGGSGPDVFHGGSAGNNVLKAGTGTATLFGGGNGDRLYANGSGAQILYAGSGNETLTGSSVGGASDTFVASAGATTVSASPTDSNLFEFIFGSAGGTELVTGLSAIGDVSLHLSGYGANDLSKVTAQDNSGGDLHISLTDGTQITFKNITAPLTNSNFS